MKNQREIKFRAYSVGQQEWEYFVIDNLDNERKIKRDVNTIGIGSEIYKYLMESGLRWWGQYTGLKDKNGREAYEGDVVRYFNMDKEMRAEIFYTTGFEGDSNLFMGYILPKSYNADIQYPPPKVGERAEGLEVIGNVFEHPNLLKEK